MKNIDGDIRVIINNLTSLFILQIANYILPLITIPYLVRVLGPEKYGLLSFSQAFLQYFILLTDYGFNFTATKKISIYRDDATKLSRIFINTIIIKGCLALLSLIILISIVLLIPKFKNDLVIYLFSYGSIIGSVLLPVWFFQGIEKMKYITGLTLLSKLLFTVLIFYFIKNQSDYIFVPLLNSIGSVLAGIISLVIIFKKIELNSAIFDKKMIIHDLFDGWYLFLSSFARSFYSVSNSFILGLLTDNITVGYFSAGEKIVSAIQGLITPISQSVYPYISKLAAKSKNETLLFLKKLFFIFAGFGMLLSIILFIFAELIVGILLGNQYYISITIIKMLACLPFISAINNVFGVQTLLPFGLNKAFSTIVIKAGFINLIMAIFLIPIYSYKGICVSVVLTEIIITILLFNCHRKYKISFINKNGKILSN